MSLNPSSFESYSKHAVLPAVPFGCELAGLPISCLRSRGLLPPRLWTELARSMAEDMVMGENGWFNAVQALSACFYTQGQGNHS
jgi:hypothetical protein